MARTKDAVLAPEQKELMEKEYLDFVKPSAYGNKANPSSCNSLYDDVENPELRAIVEKVAATTPYREETSTNEAQSPPNPQKRISGKQRKATLEEYQQTFLQVPRIDDRKPVFVSSDVRDRLDRVVRILGGRRMSVSGIIENIVRLRRENNRLSHQRHEPSSKQVTLRYSEVWVSWSTAFSISFLNASSKSLMSPS